MTGMVEKLVRAPKISFLGPPTGRPRTLRESLAAPQSGLGPGWRSRLATDAPLLFKHMPEAFRVLVARRHLGPAGGWWTRETIEQRVDVITSISVKRASMRGDQVALDLVDMVGAVSEICFDHVVAATGYRPELSRLGFLAPELRQLRTVAGAPALSANFESSSPGLYFAGLAGVNDFGPVVRFAFGADFTATRLSRHLARQERRHPAHGRAAARPQAAARALVDPA